MTPKYQTFLVANAFLADLHVSAGVPIHARSTMFVKDFLLYKVYDTEYRVMIFKLMHTGGQLYAAQYTSVAGAGTSFRQPGDLTCIKVQAQQITGIVFTVLTKQNAGTMWINDALRNRPTVFPTDPNLPKAQQAALLDSGSLRYLLLLDNADGPREIKEDCQVGRLAVDTITTHTTAYVPMPV